MLLVQKLAASPSSACRLGSPAILTRQVSWYPRSCGFNPFKVLIFLQLCQSLKCPQLCKPNCSISRWRREQDGLPHQEPHTRHRWERRPQHSPGGRRAAGRTGVTALSTYSVKVQDSLLTFHFAFTPRIQRDHTLLQFHNNLSRGRFCLGLLKTGKSLTKIRNLEKKFKLKILSVPDQMPLNPFHSGSGADLYTVFWNVQEDETH